MNIPKDKLLQYIKRKTQGGNRKVGVLLATTALDNTVRVGWSLCNVQVEPFNVSRGIEIAMGRCCRGSKTAVPSSISKEYDKMCERANRYFKKEHQKP